LSTESELWVIDADPMYRQLGLLVMDGSGSMTLDCRDGNQRISKARAAELAAHDMLGRLCKSTNSVNFWLAAISFDITARTKLVPTPVLDIPKETDFNPLGNGWEGTQLESGLHAAEQMARAFLQDADDFDSCVVILMSDGRDREDGKGGINFAAQEARRAAEAIKSIANTTLCVTYFDTDGRTDPLAQQLLGELASPDSYKNTHDADELRDFFFTSLTSNGSPWRE